MELWELKHFQEGLIQIYKIEKMIPKCWYKQQTENFSGDRTAVLKIHECTEEVWICLLGCCNEESVWRETVPTSVGINIIDYFRKHEARPSGLKRL